MENINVNAERVQKFNSAVKNVKTQLRRDLVGQDEVVDAVSRAIRRSRVGISPKR